MSQFDSDLIGTYKKISKVFMVVIKYLSMELGVKSKSNKLTEEELKKMELMAAKKPGLIEYAHNVGSFVIEKLNIEEMKSTVLMAMQQQTEMQLTQIYEQVELLAKQAERIKERADVSRRVYKAKIGFKPSIGNTYYLYKQENGEEVLSLVSPDEWGESLPYSFIASVKLLADHTWFIRSVSS